MGNGMIEIDSKSAEEIATELEMAAESVQRASQKYVTKAEKTTLTVNDQAQKANDEAMELGDLFAAQFKKTIENIRSVEKEFKRTDLLLHNDFNNLIFPYSPERLAVYDKAKKG